jgi:hypothetical protein
MDLQQVTAADYLRARDIVADEIKKVSSVQHTTRNAIAEKLMANGWLDVAGIIASREVDDLEPDPNAHEL